MYVSIIITLLALISRLFMVSNLVNFSIRDYFKKVLAPIILVTVISATPPLLIQYFFEEDTARILLVITSSLFTFISAGYLIGLNKEERVFLRVKYCQQ